VRPGRDLFWNTRVKDERGQDVFVPLSKTASYVTEAFYTMLNVFYTSENLGCLPFSGGWAEQPAWITQALSVLKVEKYLADEEERKQKQKEEEARHKHGRR
jgi:hypothetical protein